MYERAYEMIARCYLREPRTSDPIRTHIRQSAQNEDKLPRAPEH